HVDAVLRREAGRGRCGCPVRLERGGHRGTVDDFFEIGLPLGHARDADRQPPRRRVGFHRRFRNEALFAQLPDDDLAKLVGEVGQPARRQLLASDLEQQFAIHYRGPSAGCPWLSRAPVAGSTYRLATPIASCRTRRMYAVRSVTPMLLLESRILKRCEHFSACSSAGQIKFDRRSASAKR